MDLVSQKDDEPLTRTSESSNHELHFDPVITLPEVKIATNEEDEVVLIKQRAKLFRLDVEDGEWKERGTGDAKLLYNESKQTVRLVMRRDRTLKLCANHYLTPGMKLKPNCGSDRAWVWNTLADFSDDLAHPEVLGIKFINAETAERWRSKFEEAKKLVYSDLLGPDKIIGDDVLREEKDETDTEPNSSEVSPCDDSGVADSALVEKDEGLGDEGGEIEDEMTKLHIEAKDKAEEEAS